VLSGIRECQVDPWIEASDAQDHVGDCAGRVIVSSNLMVLVRTDSRQETSKRGLHLSWSTVFLNNVGLEVSD
jgi:hypothetical protein